MIKASFVLPLVVVLSAVCAFGNEAAEGGVVATFEPGRDGEGPASVLPELEGQVTVELVSDFESNRLVSDLELFRPVTEPVLDADGRASGQLVTLG